MIHKNVVKGVPPLLSGFVCANHPAVRVQVPSTPSMLLSFIVFVLYLSCEKNENKQKEAGFGPFFKKMLLKLTVKIEHKDLHNFFTSGGFH